MFVECSSCGACLASYEYIAGNCPYCGSVLLRDREPQKGSMMPEGLIPFRVTKDRARDHFKKWISEETMHPRDLGSEARFDLILGVYVPFWSFDVKTYTHWKARGTSWDEIEDSEGRTRRINERSYEISGELRGSCSNVQVPATKGIDRTILDNIGHYDQSKLAPIDYRYLSDFATGVCTVDQTEGWKNAKDEINTKVAIDCDKKAYADSHTDMQVQVKFLDVKSRQVLLPIWIGSYQYKSKVRPIYINGQTGQVFGDKPGTNRHFFYLALATLILFAFAYLFVGLCAIAFVPIIVVGGLLHIWETKLIENKEY